MARVERVVQAVTEQVERQHEQEDREAGSDRYPWRLVHVVARGALDHGAFRATGLHAMLEHLKREKIAFSQRRANDQDLLQLSSTIPAASMAAMCVPPILRSHRACPSRVAARRQQE